jgi:hypothetical protein
MKFLMSDLVRHIILLKLLYIILSKGGGDIGLEMPMLILM